MVNVNIMSVKGPKLFSGKTNHNVGLKCCNVYKQPCNKIVNVTVRFFLRLFLCVNFRPPVWSEISACVWFAFTEIVMHWCCILVKRVILRNLMHLYLVALGGYDLYLHCNNQLLLLHHHYCIYEVFLFILLNVIMPLQKNTMQSGVSSF